VSDGNDSRTKNSRGHGRKYAKNEERLKDKEKRDDSNHPWRILGKGPQNEGLNHECEREHWDREKEKVG